ncbi:MAG: hypothetical protein IJY01_05125 [Clostridia bacterium]|nr:hypothetical protein [Clostridia bacterium]
MEPIDIIILIAILLIIGGAVAYIIKAKMSGKRCIGCPESATCKSSCSGSCSTCSCGCGTKLQTAENSAENTANATAQDTVENTANATAQDSQDTLSEDTEATPPPDTPDVSDIKPE